MISVSLSTLIFWGMFLGVLMLGAHWLVAVLRERRDDRRVRSDLVHCRICGHIYKNDDGGKISACPACGSLNETARPRPI
jgi:uncharacterized paraquat-inducible protein A